MTKYHPEGPPRKRYVNRAEMMQQALARQLLLEEALEAAKPPEATPALAICRFEALWRVCPDECPREALSGCELCQRRADSILRARQAVLISRAGL
jgi:hypothetical protein